MSIKWTVKFTSKAGKQAKKLPFDIIENLGVLVREITHYGPEVRNWPHYGKLKGKKDCYHCHLRPGRPTYVAVWQITDAEKAVIEVKYVGTHEGADYRRLC